VDVPQLVERQRPAPAREFGHEVERLAELHGIVLHAGSCQLIVTPFRIASSVSPTLSGLPSMAFDSATCSKRLSVK